MVKIPKSANLRKSSDPLNLSDGLEFSWQKRFENQKDSCGFPLIGSWLGIWAARRAKSQRGNRT